MVVVNAETKPMLYLPKLKLVSKSEYSSFELFQLMSCQISERHLLTGQF